MVGTPASVRGHPVTTCLGRCLYFSPSQAQISYTLDGHSHQWLSMMADPLLAQSAVDRLTSTAHELIIEGES